MAWDVMSGVTKMAWDVMSGVTKTAWDVLSGVANLCGMFCPGCKKMAWDVLSRDVLSASLSDNMDWVQYILETSSKATKTLGFLAGTWLLHLRVLRKLHVKLLFGLN